MSCANLLYTNQPEDLAKVRAASRAAITAASTFNRGNLDTPGAAATRRYVTLLGQGNGYDRAWMLLTDEERASLDAERQASYQVYEGRDAGG